MAEIAQITSLFNRVYDSKYPIESVYDPRFWNTHIESRFISLVACIEGKTIAHFALNPDKDYPDQVQLSFPVIDPDYTDYMPLLGTKLSEIIDRISEQRGWKLLSHFILGSAASSAAFIKLMGGFREVAIFPGYFPKSE
ncbi:MAG: hypothetical protein KDD53_08075, partial [Bdellovibrionales bacterium]|nr:hypothetical protein [Bdellovibrionales bacterium]